MSINLKANVQEAVKLYLTTTAVDNADIRRIFGCGSTTASKLKKLAHEQEIKDGILQPSPYTVNTISAYKAWGLDIKDLKKRYIEHQRLIKEGIL